MQTRHKLSFTSDYMEGAHPEILKRLMETNLVKTTGYGLDEFSEAARDKIRDACEIRRRMYIAGLQRMKM